MKAEFIRFLNRLHVYSDYYYCMKHSSCFSNKRVLINFFKYVPPYHFLDYLGKNETNNLKWDEIRLLWIIYLLDNQIYDLKNRQIWYAVHIILRHHNLNVSSETLRKFFPYLKYIEDKNLQSLIKIEYKRMKLIEEVSNNKENVLE